MLIFEAQKKIDVLEKVRSTEPKAGNGQKSSRTERDTEARERKNVRRERERERLGIG